eukprot:4096211-Alexandrium_andersonii.AAC.1
MPRRLQGRPAQASGRAKHGNARAHLQRARVRRAQAHTIARMLAIAPAPHDAPARARARAGTRGQRTQGCFATCLLYTSPSPRD